jgi:predicted amidohydrolase YtcJ
MRYFHSFIGIAAAITFAAWLWFALPLQGQEAGLEVTVSDASGTLVHGATISAESSATGRINSEIAGPDGRAVFDLVQGSYHVSVTARGFLKWTGSTELNREAIVPLHVQLSIPNVVVCEMACPMPRTLEMTDFPIASLIPYASPKKTMAMGAAFATSPDAPDLILFHGAILTGEGLKEEHPQIVSAIAIRNGNVLTLGSDAEIKRLAGPQTKLRDVNGAFLMPGLNDAHTHLGGAGQTKLNVDLTGTQSLNEMLQRIQAKAQSSPVGHWLTGGGWDHTLWANKTLPTRQDLDRVTGGHPTLLERIDGHIAVANTAALKAANVTGQTKAPQGGAIDLDAQGEPTGILRDTAMEDVEKIIPPPSHEDRRHGLKLAIEDAISHGLTSVQDYSDWQDFLVFEELEKENELPIRISEWLTFSDPIDVLKQHRAHHDQNDPLLHTGMLKGFMDGSLGSRTAAMKAPFADEPSNSGLPRYDQAKLNAMAVERAQAGFQLGFHAIGDRAASMALEAFAQPIGGSPGQTVADGHRDRIEHAQVVDPSDIARFAKLGVIASMQPNHLLTDMNWAMDRLGPQRAAYSYAWKAFLDAGVVVAFGTDYPVEPVTPFRGLYAAVTRANEAGTKTYFPENKLTRTQALYAYTQGSAYAEFAEKRKGKLAPGYEADLILLDRNLLTVPAPEILKTKVLETVVNGKTVYKAQPKIPERDKK